MTAEELRTSLLSAPKNGYTALTAEQRQEMEAYALRYRAFMDACKTEREATAWATEMAEKHGFVPAQVGMDVKPGDKIYLNNRGKSFMIAVIGKPCGCGRRAAVPLWRQLPAGCTGSWR